MCGLIGIVGSESVFYNAVQEALHGLLTLQHRGQDAAGVCFWDTSTEQLQHFRKKGVVATLFEDDRLQQVNSHLCLGHTRYATVGKNNENNVQPMVWAGIVQIAMAHNGNLVNYHAMARDWERRNGPLNSSNDVEIVLNYWSEHLGEDTLDLQNFLERARLATAYVMEKSDGAYAVVGLLPKFGLIGFRDPKGIRPLVLGIKKNAHGIRHCLASESTALQMIGFEYVRDVKPGELIWIDLEGTVHSVLCCEHLSSRRSCMFEWVYFSAPESVVDGLSVYGARLELGRKLAPKVCDRMKQHDWTPDIVCPIPDTSRPATIALAETLQIPYREVFIKNLDVQRSFILGTQSERERAVIDKLSPIASEIEGRDILLVDDSIVRGTTSKKLVSMLRQYGAKRVSLAVSCPPIQHPCLYGIDFPSPQELLANRKTIAEVADWIGVDHLIYLDVEDLTAVLGAKICMGCVNSEYPTKLFGQEEFTNSRIQSDRQSL
jgi:amidophosphoribosyltransferase